MKEIGIASKILKFKKRKKPAKMREARDKKG